MSEHTPGPWFPASPDGLKWSVVTRNGDAGYFIAEVMRFAPGDPGGAGASGAGALDNVSGDGPQS